MRYPRTFYILLSVLLVLILFADLTGYGQKPAGKPVRQVPSTFCIDGDEMALYQMVNEYRKMFDLKPVPLSRSLSYIAALHAKDLFLNHPDQGPCNLHSWSAKGTWKPFCYPRDEDKKNSVWDKPKEITGYPSKGYEIVYWENSSVNIDSVMSVWRSEAYFNDFLMNTGKWEGRSWNAIGIAIYENYACAWFGEIPDPEGTAWVCGNPPKKQAPDSTKRLKPAPAPAASSKPNKSDTAKRTPPAKTPAAPAKTNRPDTASTIRSGATADTTKGKPDSTLVGNSRVWKFYIIIRTNVTRKLADQIVKDQKNKGFQDAKVLLKNGKIRVSVYETTDKDAAQAKLKEIRKVYKDAWLLKE